MTHFPDLSGDVVRRIGWLEAGHDYARGAVSAGDLALIERLVLHTWKPPFSANGWHDCSLCGRKPGDGPLRRVIEGREAPLGVWQIYVPDSDLMYEAPTLIVHYIEEHGYLPPDRFLDALRRADPGSPEYHAACDALARRASIG
jgi:hypothetical protein